MTDLVIALAVMGLLSVALGLACGWTRLPEGQGRTICLTLALVGGFAFLWYAAGRLYWVHLVDSSAVIVWSNWTPLFFAMAAGLAYRLPNTPRWRRLLSAGLLAAVAVPALFWPLLGPLLRPPAAGDTLVHRGVVMQSSWATCSPAAAATLFTQAGTPTTEREMIDPCLTDHAGTPTLGLYRGVKLKAQSVGRDVQLISGDIDRLLSRDDWPVLLLVRLPESGVDDPRYQQQWGWIPGMGHSVVAAGVTADGQIEILDPSSGREWWQRQDLEVLWHGDGLQLSR